MSKRLFPMPEKNDNSNLRKNKKSEVRMNTSDRGQLKIAKIIYGNKNLADCMESVIKLHMEK